jgi:putative flavoprotein involved in K+ transport
VIEGALPRRDVDVVIVGGGQSGLALGYHLARRCRRFVILDTADRVGHAWRARWDSLRLITPCPYNDLPGMSFPAPVWSFPHKDEVADYLERYAETFALPVRLGERVSSVQKGGTGYLVKSTTAVYDSKAVVIATGPFQHPCVPEIAAGADPSLVQLHSSQYKNPDQLPDGEILVVGCGNSGAGIAMDLSSRRRVHLALGDTGTSPRSILGRDLFWWVHNLRLSQVTIDSRLGKHLSSGPDALIGITPEQIGHLGVRVGPRLVRFEGQTSCFADGARQRVDAVIWATGFRPRYDFLVEPVTDARGAPIHRRGVTRAEGLYFLGLKWQYRFDSSLLGGVGRDAAHLAEQITSHLAGRPSTLTPQRDHTGTLHGHI